MHGRLRSPQFLAEFQAGARGKNPPPWSSCSFSFPFFPSPLAFLANLANNDEEKEEEKKGEEYLVRFVVSPGNVIISWRKIGRFSFFFFSSSFLFFFFYDPCTFSFLFLCCLLHFCTLITFSLRRMVQYYNCGLLVLIRRRVVRLVTNFERGKFRGKLRIIVAQNIPRTFYHVFRSWMGTNFSELDREYCVFKRKT